jgi:hypothetical protein
MAANQVPDHATIARFVIRHEAALGELFGSVLALCAKAGLLSTGVVAIDGTKLNANASREANSDYERIAREIVAEAKATTRPRTSSSARRAAMSCPRSCRRAPAGESGCAKPSRRSMPSGRRIDRRPLHGSPRRLVRSRAAGP